MTKWLQNWFTSFTTSVCYRIAWLKYSYLLLRTFLEVHEIRKIFHWVPFVKGVQRPNLAPNIFKCHEKLVLSIEWSIGPRGMKIVCCLWSLLALRNWGKVSANESLEKDSEAFYASCIVHEQVWVFFFLFFLFLLGLL